VAQIYLRALGSLSVASYDSLGLQWKYSDPPTHGVTRTAQKSPLKTIPLLLRSCLSHCLATSVSAEPFTSNGCLFWLLADMPQYLRYVLHCY
jgi:hypothetical protein